MKHVLVASTVPRPSSSITNTVLGITPQVIGVASVLEWPKQQGGDTLTTYLLPSRDGGLTFDMEPVYRRAHHHHHCPPRSAGGVSGGVDAHTRSTTLPCPLLLLCRFSNHLIDVLP